jgi:hypothetical protein
VWPGNYTDKVGEPGPTAWRRDEIVAQIRATREQLGATGNVHFSMRVLLENRDSVGTALERLVYAEPALVPASPWMMPGVPSAPVVTLTPSANGPLLSLTPAAPDPVRWWAVQVRLAGRWETHLLDGAARSVLLHDLVQDLFVPPDLVNVTAVDRVGNAGAPAALRLP